MKKLTVLFFGVLIATSFVNAQKTKWAFDKAHSKIQFDIDHMVISEITGQFHTYDGEILADKEDFTDVKVNLTIDVKSIDTDHEKRDEHLRSSDFFDIVKYPSITFKSISMKKVDGKYHLKGNLTMHGVTKNIDLYVQYGGSLKDPYGNTRVGFKITGIINRTDFGLVYNSVLEAGGVLIGEEVTFKCNIELIKQK